MLAFRVATDLEPSRRSIASSSAFGLVDVGELAGCPISLVAPGRRRRPAPFYTELETWRGAFPPLGEPWRLPYWLLDVHTGNMLAYPNGGNNFGSLATAILVVLGCLALRRSRPALLAMLL